MLKIENLQVEIENKHILNGLSLEIKAGEVHAIMGPNASGKSTLSKTIAGHESCNVISGSIHFKGKDLLDMDVDVRAKEGIFMGFQNPIEIPGVNSNFFLKTAINERRKYLGLEELKATDFVKKTKEKLKLLKIDQSMLQRSLNEGFSGGEKKRNEILQMLMLEPDFILLDEIDSGLDIDAMQIISEGVNHMRSKERGILLITHYQRLLNYIQPDFVHILVDGKIVKTGDKTLAYELEQTGYSSLAKAV